MDMHMQRQKDAANTPVAVNTNWGKANKADGAAGIGILISSMAPEGATAISTTRKVLICGGDIALKFLPHRGGGPKNVKPNGFRPAAGNDVKFVLKNNHVYRLGEIGAEQNIKDGSVVNLMGLDYSLYADKTTKREAISLNLGTMVTALGEPAKKVLREIRYIRHVDFDAEDAAYLEQTYPILGGAAALMETPQLQENGAGTGSAPAPEQAKDYGAPPIGFKFRIDNKFVFTDDFFMVPGQIGISNLANPASFKWCKIKTKNGDIPEDQRVYQMCLGAFLKEPGTPGPLPYIITQVSGEGADLKQELVCVFLTLYTEDLKAFMFHPVDDLDKWEAIAPFIQKSLAFDFNGSIDKHKTMLLGGEIPGYDYSCAMVGRAVIDMRKTLENGGIELTPDQCMTLLENLNVGFNKKTKNLLHGSYTLQELRASVLGDKDSVCLISNLKQVNLAKLFDSGKCKFYMIGSSEPISLKCKYKMVYAMTIDGASLKWMITPKVMEEEEDVAGGGETEQPKKKVKGV